MTPEEITKLAEEYAVEVTKDMAKTLDEPSCLLNETKRATKEYITDFMQWLLRTHCIVSKEKVRKMRDNELEFAQFYQRKANSCINQHCRIDYETSRDIAKSRAKLLESLFDVETFKNSEV